MFSDKAWAEKIGVFYAAHPEIPARVIAQRLGVHVNTLHTQMLAQGHRRMLERDEVPELDTLLEDFKAATRPADLAVGWALDDLAKTHAEAREAKADNDNQADAVARLPAPKPITLSAAQTPPAKCADGSDWSTWLFLGGRGAGKTLAGAMWLSQQAEATGRVALVGPTLHDVREVMIGGPSGLMALPCWSERGEWPVYEPSRRRVVFPGGGVAYAFSAEDPDSLRGPQFAAAWADEYCAWTRPEETLAMLRLGLRLGARPRLVVTTTPRPMRSLRALKAEANSVFTHAATTDNADNLAPGFLEDLRALYGGTRREAQELEGVILDGEGGLFRAEDLSGARDLALALFPGGYRPSGYLSPQTPNLAEGYRPSGYLSPQTPNVAQGDGPVLDRSMLDRVVVAVDPTTTVGGDACGIVAVGRAGERAHVLADRSQRGLTPDGWARRALRLMDEVGASTIVAEVNQGGDMVAQTLRTLRPEVHVTEVRATRGKRMRAEPVAALYEQGRVCHHEARPGALRELEEELMAVGGPDDGRLSLDRADALVWGLTELMIRPRGDRPRFTQL